MAKYLFRVNYTLDGIRGVVDKGGSAREKATREAIESLGGTVDCFYYAFGACDLVIVADFPDNIAVAALALAVSAGGGANVETTVLLTPKEIDKAAKRHVAYRPPTS
ncbi:MAG TPA: GYD domain-containing protein [Acidimicrobiales bacterium]|nr:GYD domain-containing protein [Acidimicrobiales bacterium]